MRNYLLFISLLASLQLFAQQPFSFSEQYNQFSANTQAADRNGAACLPDSTKQYNFSSPTDSVLNNKVAWHYNGNDKVARFYVNFGPVLQLLVIDSIIYDDLDRLTFQETKTYFADSSNLVLTYRVHNFFHGAGTQYDSSITYRYNYSYNLFLPGTKITQSFDANNRVTESDYYTWDNFDHAWSFGSHTVFTYTPAGKITQSETETWLGSKTRTVYTYTPSGKIAQVQDDSWDGQMWVPQLRRANSYDANDSLVLILNTNLVSNMLVYKGENIYDVPAHRTEKRYINYDPTTGLEANSGKSVEILDNLGRVQQSESYSTIQGETSASRSDFIYVGNSTCIRYFNAYNLVAGEWKFTYRTYYFSDYSVTTQEPAAIAAWSVYPNPAQDWLWLDAPAGSRFQLFDLQGKLLKSGVAQGHEQLALPGINGTLLLMVGEGKAAGSRLIRIGD